MLPLKLLKFKLKTDYKHALNEQQYITCIWHVKGLKCRAATPDGSARALRPHRSALCDEEAQGRAHGKASARNVDPLSNSLIT